MPQMVSDVFHKRDKISGMRQETALKNNYVRFGKLSPCVCEWPVYQGGQVNDDETGEA
jgi:hypothetical protein